LLFKTFAKAYLEEKRSSGKYEVDNTDMLYIRRLLDYAGNGNLMFPERSRLVYLKQIKRVYKDKNKPIQYISERR